MTQYDGDLDFGPDASNIEDVVLALHALLQASAAGGVDGSQVRATGSALCEHIHEAIPPFSLQFAGGQVFRDRVLVPITDKTWAASVAVAKVLGSAAIHELTFTATPYVQAVMDLAQALTSRERPKGAPFTAEVDGIEWCTIEGLRSGAPLESGDPDLFAIHQVAMAVAQVEALLKKPASAWDFDAGLAAVARIERIVGPGIMPLTRAMEFGGNAWTPSRRTVSACLHVLCVGKHLGVSPRTCRVCAHVVLAVACAGYRKRGAQSWAEATAAARTRLERSLSENGMGSEPHHFRTSALLNHVASLAQPGKPPTASLLPGVLRLCYQVEAIRCPAHAPFDLTLADCLALVAPEAAEMGDMACLKALAAAYGHFPPGSRVRLEDGRVGLVQDASSEGSLQPMVMVDGRFQIPEDPVTLVSPTELITDMG